MIKVLRSYSADDPPRELARFEQHPDGRVTATYASESLRAQHEAGGVYTARTGRVKIGDGRKFLDALELSVSTSSFLRLEPA